MISVAISDAGGHIIKSQLSFFPSIYCIAMLYTSARVSNVSSTIPLHPPTPHIIFLAISMVIYLYL